MSNVAVKEETGASYLHLFLPTNSLDFSHFLSLMLLEATSDATTLSYWLNWRVLLCAIWVFTSMAVALWMIWKYEVKDQVEQRSQETQQDENRLQSYRAWRPCLRQIHPIWLLAFRLFAFSLLLASLIVKALITGASIFYYYTQWTFTLLTIYFACGSVVSIYGVFHHHETSKVLNTANGIDEEQHSPLLSGNPSNVIRGCEVSDCQEQSFTSRAASMWSYIIEVLFQMNAGAVILTDCTYWFIIFPFLTIKDYNMNFMTVNMHTLNLVLLLGDTALNSLRLPFFRISFFFLWTGVFVISQWIIHAAVSIGWPYPFLDLSAPLAPLWYLLMGLIHIPSYGIFMLILKLKHHLMSKWFPLSYQF